MSGAGMNELAMYASIGTFVILVLCLMGALHLKCKLASVDGFESDPVISAATGGASLRSAAVNSQNALATGIPLSAGQYNECLGRPCGVEGFASMPGRLGFNNGQFEPPVFWNEGNMDQIVANNVGLADLGTKGELKELARVYTEEELKKRRLGMLGAPVSVSDAQRMLNPY